MNSGLSQVEEGQLFVWEEKGGERAIRADLVVIKSGHGREREGGKKLDYKEVKRMKPTNTPST